MANARQRRRPPYARYTGQLLLVTRHERTAGSPMNVEAVELWEEQGGLDIIHIVLPAKHRHVPVLVTLLVAIDGRLGHAVQSEQAKTLGELRVVRDDASPFAAGQALGRVEREAGRIAELARPHAVAFPFDAVRRVLDDPKVVA